MNHIKDNWTENEVFHASDLNNISRLVNELIDKQGTVINDSNPSTECTYSSNKTLEAIAETQSSVINDEQASGDSTYSSIKVDEEVENSAFKVAVVDELPEEGEESTMYLTPARKTYQVNEVMSMYIGENNVPTIYTELLLFVSSISNSELSGISIGDVVKIDATVQKCMRTYSFYDSNTKCNLTTGSTLFKGHYSIGNTFKVTSPDSGDGLITSYNSIGLDSESVKGITGKIVIESGKVYRMTGFEQIPDESIDNSHFKEVYNAFVATFELVSEEDSADYEVEKLGSIFVKKKPSTKQYIVLSEINKNELIGAVNAVFSGESYPILNVPSGVTRAITLQDGHYYRLKDRYLLRDKNISGNFMPYLVLTGYMAEALIYEEVDNPSSVKYEDVDFAVPGALCVFPDVYGLKKCGCTLTEDDGIYKSLWEFSFCEIPKGLMVGDVLKIIGENPGIDFPNLGRTLCVTSAKKNISAELDDGELTFKTDEITSTAEWKKNERYRLTDLIKIGNFSQIISELLAEFALNKKIEGIVPVFEKVSDEEEFDYEVNGLPGIIVSITGKAQSKDKWMWADGDWEFISGPEHDTDEEAEDNGNGE